MSGIQQLLLAGGGAAVPVDPYFYSVTSLLHGDGTNGGQNNTFLDSSTNNFTITRNGNTTQGSFSPFSQTGWGVYQGAIHNDYASFTTSAGSLFEFTGDFTVEAWVYYTSNAADCSLWVTQGAAFFALNIDSTNYNIYLNSGSPTSSFSHGIALNAWTHVAMVRSGSTVTVYTNGLSRGTITNSSTLGYSSPTLARFGGGAAGSNTRYVSNLRIVKGTAVYTTAFTPPTTPLTAISGTSLLTCQSNRFLDASSNSLVATVTGSPSVQPFSPFNPITAYSTSAVGGSGYFDGSGDYLLTSSGVSGSGKFSPGSAYTFDCWFYIDGSIAGGGEAVWFVGGSTIDWNATTGVQYQLYLYAGSLYWSFNNGGSPVNMTVTLPASGQWVHFAVGYNGTTTRLWVNGTTTTTSTSSYATVSYANVSTGAQYTGGVPFNGYVGSTRFVTGADLYGVGNTSITVPTAPFTTTASSGTVNWLTNFTNGAIFDNAAVADYETVGNAQISTSVKKYGTGSLAFDGTGDYLVTDAPSTELMTFGTGNFTVEFWLYVAVLPGAGTYDFIYDSRPSVTNGLYPSITLKGSTLVYFTDSADRITSGSISATTWYHVALCRVAGQTKLFINGAQAGSTYADTNSYLCGASRPTIGGAGYTSTSIFNGYIDDLRISKGVGRYPYNFTPPTAEFPNIGGTVTLTADPYFDYTTLLLPGNGTNGAQNNTFLDSSTNAFSITRNGNTTQGTFSPFSQTGWGNYFDGTGDYLSVADNAALDLGTGDFTIEGWVYIADGIADNAGIVSKRNASAFNAGDYRVSYRTGTSKITFADDTVNERATPVVQKNSWVHFAIVRESGTISAYANGVRGDTAADTVNLGNADVQTIGVNSTIFFTGYISNVRIVKGTAVYSGATYTIPTAPLTAVTNTSLLTCQSNRFIDNSTNNFAITANGDVSVQAFSPFNPTAAWSAATNGGSGYFDGSGDALYAPANAAFNFDAPSGNTNDFTVEMWVYPLNFSNIYFLYGTGPSGGADQFYLNTDSRAYYFDGSSQISSPVLTANSWNHLALVRNGSGSNNIRVYGNGVSGTAVTSSNSLGSSVNSPYIGSRSDGSYPLPGYISSLRVVKGTAVYTTGFTPPTAPLTAIANTSLLTNYTNAGIYDATSKNDLETVGNAQISTTQSKFGGSSMYFDGTGDWLIGRTTDLASFGTGDFTIEGWLYPSAVTGADRCIWDTRAASGDAGMVVFIGTAGTMATYSSGSVRVVSTNALSANTWQHFALCRYNGTMAYYINGVQNGTLSYTSAITCPGRVSVAVRFDDAAPYTGYINDLRATKGIARYTSNFTPPTTAFLTL